MNSLFLPLLMGGGQPADGANPIMSFLPFIAIIAIFYFLIIRPQSRKRKETETMLGTMKKGDKVVTIGGIHGTIQNVRDQTVIVKVDESVKLEFSRGAIATVQPMYKEDKEVSSDDDTRQ